MILFSHITQCNCNLLSLIEYLIIRSIICFLPQITINEQSKRLAILVNKVTSLTMDDVTEAGKPIRKGVLIKNQDGNLVVVFENDVTLEVS